MCSDTWMEVDYLEIKVQKVNLSFKGYRMLAKYRKNMSVALKLQNSEADKKNMDAPFPPNSPTKRTMLSFVTLHKTGKLSK